MMKKITSMLLVPLVVLAASGSAFLAPVPAYAATLTSFSDTLSTIKASTAANHTISFVTPSGVASGQTIILTFDNGTSVAGGLTFADVDVNDNGSPITLAGTPSGATAGVVRTSSTVITFTNGTTAITAGHTIQILIGTNATTGGTGTQQITNGSAGTTTLSITGSFTDTGVAAMPIIANDVVAVTATVAPIITFALSTNAIDFGTLSASAGRWATATAGSGGTTAAASTTPTPVSHTMTVGTNASGGYVITYNGATLTSASSTIAVATITSDSDGTPGTAQFAASYSTSGSATITSGYANRNSTAPDWKWVAGSAQTIVTNTSATASETISASYLANIASSTPPGAYSTNITYVATGTF